MKPVRKYFSSAKVKQLVNIYDRFYTDILPKIYRYSFQENNPYIDFILIEGKPIEKNNLSIAFYELGKFHRSNFIKNESTGFSTLCHGDFHAGNIIEANNGITFIDVTDLHIGNNYGDLDYLDLFNWYKSATHPWMIKDRQCFEKYIDGADLHIKKKEQINVKKIIMKETLEKFIRNGIKSKVNTDLEKKLLKKLLDTE